MASTFDIRHGDCLDLLRTLPDKSVDLFITSPPYNLGVSSGGGFPDITKKQGKWGGGELSEGYLQHTDDMPYPDYVAWQKEVLAECWRVLTDTGAIYYNHKPRIQNGQLQTPLDLHPNLPVRQIIIWKRPGGINFSPTFYLPSHEWIVIFAKPAFRLKSKSASGLKDVWEFPPAMKNPHPAPFPMRLPMMILNSVKASVVCDPFMGSGTVGVACANVGCSFIGFDNSAQYVAMAKSRISKFIQENTKPEPLTEAPCNKLDLVAAA